MNEDTLVVVHCYAGDKPRVEELLPAFLHHETPILLLSPEDSPVAIPHERIFCEKAGLAGWKGAHTIQRQIEHWKIIDEFPQKWLLLHDSDSICLSQKLPAYLFERSGIFWSNVLCHEYVHLPSDKPNFNPPYFFSHDVLKKLIAAAEAVVIPDDGFQEPHDWGAAIDGFYTRLVKDVLQLPWSDYYDGATTWPPGVDLMRKVAQGARMIHGVKSWDTFVTLAHTYQPAMAEEALRESYD